MKKILSLGLSIILFVILGQEPVYAARDTNSYDGNIFPIYAGNGSLVPPASKLKDSLKSKRTTVLIFYLDDSTTSKAFAPVVSAIKLVWGTAVELIPLTTDELQGQPKDDPLEPAYYWHEKIPQTVIFNEEGEVVLDEEGQVSIDSINEAISASTGLKAPEYSIKIKSYNEYNSEASKE